MFIKITNLLPLVCYIAQGLIITLQFSLIAIFWGLIIGTLLAVFKTSRYFSLKLFAKIYTSVFRGTPILIQLSIIYFGLPAIMGVKLSVFTAGVLSFSLNSGAYVSEIIRSGINSVDPGQFEAAKVLGIPSRLMMKDIILPQAIRTVLPSLVNEFISLIKESALISTIGGMDLMRRAQAVAAETYDFFTPMLIAAIIYYITILIISNLAVMLEKKLTV